MELQLAIKFILECIYVACSIWGFHRGFDIVYEKDGFHVYGAIPSLKTKRDPTTSKLISTGTLEKMRRAKIRYSMAKNVLRTLREPNELVDDTVQKLIYVTCITKKSNVREALAYARKLYSNSKAIERCDVSTVYGVVFLDKYIRLQPEQNSAVDTTAQ